MPKPVYQIAPQVIRELKKAVIKMAAFPIRTKADASYLSLLMKRQGIDNLSESTLLRFFSNKQTNHKFYLNTLDKLALFCGKKDFNDFEKWSYQQQDFAFYFGAVDPADKNVKSLLKICIHQNQLKPIHLFTEQLENLNIDEQLKLGFEFYQSLLTNQNSNHKFFKEFSHLPIIRESFFEKCVDPDFSIPGYELGLKYYLNQSNPEMGMKQCQDFIFAHCMLLRNYYINNNKKEALKHAILLYENYTFSNKQLDELYLYPKMRFLSYQIFYLMLKERKNAVHEQVQNLLIYCKKNMDKWQYNEQRIVFSCITETFLQAGIGKQQQQLLKEIFHELLAGYAPEFHLHTLRYMLKYTDMNGIYTYKRIAEI